LIFTNKSVISGFSLSESRRPDCLAMPEQITCMSLKPTLGPSVLSLRRSSMTPHDRFSRDMLLTAPNPLVRTPARFLSFINIVLICRPLSGHGRQGSKFCFPSCSLPFTSPAIIGSRAFQAAQDPILTLGPSNSLSKILNSLETIWMAAVERQYQRYTSDGKVSPSRRISLLSRWCKLSRYQDFFLKNA
jgi:hypothetical protein